MDAPYSEVSGYLRILADVCHLLSLKLAAPEEGVRWTPKRCARCDEACGILDVVVLCINHDALRRVPVLHRFDGTCGVARRLQDHY